jgi:hypothetical protein
MTLEAHGDYLFARSTELFDRLELTIEFSSSPLIA